MAEPKNPTPDDTTAYYSEGELYPGTNVAKAPDPNPPVRTDPDGNPA